MNVALRTLRCEVNTPVAAQPPSRTSRREDLLWRYFCSPVARTLSQFPPHSHHARDTINPSCEAMCRAIINSSLVGITHTEILLAGVEIR